MCPTNLAMIASAMGSKPWTTPVLEPLAIWANTDAISPPGGHDNLSNSDSLCPNGGNPLPTPGNFCTS